MSNSAQVFITDSDADHPIRPDTNLTSGTLSLNMTFSGTATFSAAVTFSAAITYGGVTLSNSVTGTGSMVLSASPTFTGTVVIATLSLTTVGAHTISGAITYGGVTLNNAVTGTGNMVLSTSPTITTPNIVGTSTNDNAAAGSVGEYVSNEVASGAAIALTTATPVNITSISLTAGDWDVSGIIHYVPPASTRIFAINTSVNTVSATPSTTTDRVTTLSVSATGAWVPGNAFPITQRVSSCRFSLNAVTTVYLVTNQIFDTSTLTAYGMIWARRIR